MRKKYDKIFLGLTLTLLFFGFFALASASLGLAAQEDKNSYSILLKQIALGGGIGSFLCFLTSRFYYKKWKTLSLPFFLFSFLLMLLVFEPHLGFSHGGATRWLSIGTYTFQPSELMKFAFIIYLSSWLSKRQKQVSSFKKGLLPFLIIMGIVATSLILQPDIGTLGVICITATLLFFLAGARFSQIATILALGILVIAILAFYKPYLMDRITVFLDDSQDLQGSAYQINQARIAMGSGGVWGRGFGKGLSKFNYLPEATSDSIFAVVGEEFGFVGTSTLVLLFILLLYRSLHIAKKAPNTFSRLLTSGIAILLIVPSFVNMYAVTGLMPLTGLPLTFISQGGSSLILTMAGIGIILNVSKYK